MHRVPGDLETRSLLQRGVERLRQGRPAEAAVFVERALQASPRDPGALNLLGVIYARQGRGDLAERALRRCIALAPGYAEAHNNLGNLLAARQEHGGALASYTRATQIDPRHVLAHYNRGNALKALGKLEASIAAYEEALRLQPRSFEIRVNLGNVLREADEAERAETLYRECVALRPEVPDVLVNLGNVLRARGEMAEARACYHRVLAANPRQGLAHLSLGLLELQEGHPDEAARHIEAAQALPDAPPNEALAALAQLRAAQGRVPEALEAATAAVKSPGNGPRHDLALANLMAHHNARELADQVFSRSLREFGSRPPQLLGALLANRRYLCDWRDWQGLLALLVEQVRSTDKSVIHPFHALAVPGLTNEDLLRIARTHTSGLGVWSRRTTGSTPARPRAGDGRLRLGYLSADFHQHATAYLTASLFENHDRSRFEVFAYSFGPDDQSPIRRRLLGAFEHFVEIRDHSHLEAAQRIRDDGIDILVDIKGHTRDARPEIVALGPAPIQVNWLGFPGTAGMQALDYIVVDPLVVAPEEAASYEEQLAYMPDSYFPLDPRREVAPTPSRGEAGLPEDAFVFCCFNNSYKFTPEVFELWCALLKAVPGSLLWLYADQEAVVAHLRQAAEEKGVDARRLVFAPKLPQAEHIARIPLADLFLDTQPYNAHTTASDALWMGLPVLTCRGGTFPSRVAASLLSAAGLPELITDNLGDYQALALRLATHPDELAALRHKALTARINGAPLFDARRFTRDLEALYQRMWARHQRGEPPALLPPVPARGP